MAFGPVDPKIRNLLKIFRDLQLGEARRSPFRLLIFGSFGAALPFVHFLYGVAFLAEESLYSTISYTNSCQMFGKLRCNRPAHLNP